MNGKKELASQVSKQSTVFMVYKHGMLAVAKINRYCQIARAMGEARDAYYE
jgi:hypothetical protein